MALRSILILAAAALALPAEASAPPFLCARTDDRLIGSPAAGLTVAGSTAVVAAGPNLVFVDISEPGAPVPTAEIRYGDPRNPLPFDHQIVRPLASWEDHVLVSLGSDPGVVEVFDVSDPAAPVAVGSLEIDLGVRRAAIAGNVVWVAGYLLRSGHGEHAILAIDVSDPTDPRELGRYVAPGGVEDVAAAGDVVAVVESPARLVLLDGADPSHPEVMSTAGLAGHAWRVAIVGTHAYVITSTAIEIFDLADPAAVAPVGSTSYESSEVIPTAILGSGDRLYLGHGEVEPSALYPAGGFQVFDLHDPTAPALLTSVTFSRGAYDLALGGNRLLVCDYDRGLRVFDLEVVGPPVQTGCVNPTRNDVFAVGVDGDLAFVGDQGLRVVDLGGDGVPTEIGALELEGTVTAVAVTPGPFVVLGYGGVVSPGTRIEGLLIVDRSDPLRPVARGQLDLPGTRPLVAAGLDLAGELVAVAAGDDGLILVGVADPDHPVELGRAATSLMAIGVAVADDLAVVATGSGSPTPVGRLEVFDVSDPTVPVLVGTAPFSSAARAVAVAEERAYVATADGFHVVDLADPAAPLEIGTLDRSLGIVTGLELDGDHAFASIYPGGLRVIDLSKPEQPRFEAGSTWQPFIIVDGDPMGGQDVAVHAGRAVVADGGFGLRVLDVSRCLGRLQVPAGHVSAD